MLLRCDLQEVYGVDLDDLFRKRLSWVRAAELTAGLRPGSRIHKDWSQEEHLLADQVDLLARSTWLQGIATSAAIGKKGRKALNKPPRPITRPGVDQKKTPKKFTETKDLMILLRQKNAPPPSPTPESQEDPVMKHKMWVGLLRAVDESEGTQQ